jgi:sugar phosphate isomerase/epimerase
VKDFASREAGLTESGGVSYAFRPVGEGVVPYETILPTAVACGAEWLLVEQDETDGPALDAAARSLERIRASVGSS